MLYLADAPSSLALAWHQSGEFCLRTAAAVARHPLAVLVAAAVPAAERGYVLMQSRTLPRLRLTLLEALVTLWRVLLCVVAIWAALSGSEWLRLRQRVGVAESWQLALQHLGKHIGNHLRVVLWEYVLFIAGFALLNFAITALVRALGAAGKSRLQTPEHRRAAISVLRNLILVPLAVIYLVETLRPMFQ
ncbi:hypothetical protein [Paracidobacterium acidisoli]|uniref:Uncharacterized protein n=1 Tax=Paracidobacterium acidisoli TaxID=2303751 RepID=A0A372ISZ4_9BACT|nr:hypothetical protein [Paracidobacterium acidisoli]MBT9329462.1 hypothetical protein [Paracidobacterium acidisoli]